jgi:small conductance mechanosensitive channel
LQELRDSVGQLFSAETLYGLGARTLRIIALLFATWLILRIARRALPRILRAIGRRMTARVDESEIERSKRVETLGGILLSIAIVVVWTVSLLMVLRELGFDIAPVLAGAGVVGLAVGFGAQNLVRESGSWRIVEEKVTM